MRLDLLARLCVVAGSALALFGCGGDLACVPSGDDDAEAPMDGTIDAEAAIADSAPEAVTLDVEAGPSSCPARVPTGTISADLQIDPAHTGAQPLDTVASPLCRRWERPFVIWNPIAPLILPGRVIANDRGDVYALSPEDGSTLWGPAPMEAGGMATDGKSIFVMSYSEYVAALDAVTGHLLWQVPWPDQANPGFVTVGSGTVVVSTSRGASALDAQNGNLLWAVSDLSQLCGPAAMLSGIDYFACNYAEAAAVDATTGQIHWQHAFGSGAASDDQPIVATSSGGFVLDFGDTQLLTMDETNGDMTPTAIATYFVPAVSADSVFVATYTELEAWSADLGKMLWSFQGDGRAYAAPLVVGSQVVIASKDRLYLVDAASGALVSQDPLPATPAALAEADGLLLVATNNGLVAY